MSDPADVPPQPLKVTGQTTRTVEFTTEQGTFKFVVEFDQRTKKMTLTTNALASEIMGAWISFGAGAMMEYMNHPETKRFLSPAQCHENELIIQAGDALFLAIEGSVGDWNGAA